VFDVFRFVFHASSRFQPKRKGSSSVFQIQIMRVLIKNKACFDWK